MKSILLSIAIIGAVMLTGCKNETESSNSATVVVVDSQAPTMYQNPDTLEFIKQSILQNTNFNPESVEEVKMYFGAEGSRKSMLHELSCNINAANNLYEPLSKTDIVYQNSNEALGTYCEKLAVLCDTLISNQRKIQAILNEDYSKFNFHYVIKFKNGETLEDSGIITDDCCSNGAGELWDVNKMNR